MCPPIYFACIYKAWFRYHGNHPDINFRKFFACPFQITETGPQTIPEILKTHAHICDQAALRLEAIRNGDQEARSFKRADRHRYQLLPLCRAVIMVLDQLPPFLGDRRVSLDEEIDRYTAVLVLTGCNDGLSHPVDFDGIRSESLPLERDDEIDTDKIIRVPLKTAVYFVAELQQRVERAFAHSNQDTTNVTLDSKTGHLPVAVDDDDQYANDILENPSDPDNQSRIRSALKVIEMREKGVELEPDLVLHHWKCTWT